MDIGISARRTSLGQSLPKRPSTPSLLRATSGTKPDVDHPAVFVFVKDGVTEVSALPCKGGWDSGGATQFPATPNQPAWPRDPSLKDVVYKPPATSTTQPTR